MNVRTENYCCSNIYSCNKKDGKIELQIKPKICSNCSKLPEDAKINYIKMLIENNRAPEFDAQTLEDKLLNEVFSNDELTANESVNVQSVIELGYSYLQEQIRYYEKTGELIPYKMNELLEECNALGLNFEESEHYIQNKKSEFRQKIQALKDDANKAIEKHSPVKDTRTVYRIIGTSSTQEGQNYFKKMKSLKKDEEIQLNTLPVYVSTSAKKILKAYGGDNAKNAVMFRILLPKGSKLLKFPSGDGIEQCLMKPDAKFKVVQNEKYRNDFHYVTLEYIPE